MGDGDMVKGTPNFSTGEPYKLQTAPLPLILREGLLEIVGIEGVEQIWHHAGWSSAEGLSAANLGYMELALVDIYGKPAGSGLSLRVGRAVFSQLIRQMGSELGLLKLDFRLQHARLRIRTGLERLADVLLTPIGITYALDEQPDCWNWMLQTSQTLSSFNGHPFPVNFMVGLLQEYFAWSSGGKIYQVECQKRQTGDSQAFSFNVKKQPLE